MLLTINDLTMRAGEGVMRNEEWFGYFFRYFRNKFHLKSRSGRTTAASVRKVKKDDFY